VIFAAKHVGNTHVSIVYCIAKEKGSGAIRAPDHEVSNVIGEKTLRPVHEVQKLDAAAQWHLEAQGR